MNTNTTPEQRIADGIAAERAVRNAQAVEHTPDSLTYAAHVLAELPPMDYGCLTGEDMLALLPVGHLHANTTALLSILGDLRELAWAIEDGTITLDTI